MGLLISVRGFRGAYIGKGFYPRGALQPKFKKNRLKQAITVLIKIQFKFTGFLIGFETS